MIRRGGNDEAGVADRAADPLARLLEGGVGETDDGETGQPGRDVDLDADDPAVEAVEGRGGDDGQHAATLSAGAHPRTHARLTRDECGLPADRVRRIEP